MTVYHYYNQHLDYQHRKPAAEHGDRCILIGRSSFCACVQWVDGSKSLVRRQAIVDDKPKPLWHQQRLIWEGVDFQLVVDLGEDGS